MGRGICGEGNEERKRKIGEKEIGRERWGEGDGRWGEGEEDGDRGMGRGK